ncbi:putative cruciform DNA binding protein [Piptocephalis cylindrospora]|uniref:Putative cruciform DNA binding protein n=1 Tax=Piptocephalis cylindrospora TaxID=1907219 RepID=A0A4P9Y0R0_9FUNG|nr:putative cruciform DNA binding protein [Piptocephalis cylindrospora]|eukprot:RKP12062.1 putative cruciform DNA binding protein [Piptocephalis cylindrospora]
MSAESEQSKMSANATWAKGQVKSTIGGVIGNETMRTEGEAEIAKGNADYKAAQAQGYVEGVKNDVKGNVKDGVNRVIGDDAGRAEGQAQQSLGQAQKDANTPSE